MILKTEQDFTCGDIEVSIRYAKMNQRVKRLITLMQSVDAQIKCNGENHEHLINVSEIFYIESVDKRTFVYLVKASIAQNFGYINWRKIWHSWGLFKSVNPAY